MTEALNATHAGFLKARDFLAAKAAEKALFKPEKGYFRVERHANKDRIYVYDRKGTRRIVQ